MKNKFKLNDLVLYQGDNKDFSHYRISQVFPNGYYDLKIDPVIGKTHKTDYEEYLSVLESEIKKHDFDISYNVVVLNNKHLSYSHNNGIYIVVKEDSNEIHLIKLDNNLQITSTKNYISKLIMSRNNKDLLKTNLIFNYE